jgi:hypothetical protein
MPPARTHGFFPLWREQNNTNSETALDICCSGIVFRTYSIERLEVRHQLHFDGAGSEVQKKHRRNNAQFAIGHIFIKKINNLSPAPEDHRKSADSALYEVMFMYVLMLVRTHYAAIKTGRPSSSGEHALTAVGYHGP